MKKNKERNFSIIFYLFSFTIAIFIFSIGNSAINFEMDKIKSFNKENNKILKFSLSESLTVDRLKEILKENRVSIIIKKNLDGTAIYLESYLKTDGYYYEEDMKVGKFFSKNDFEGSEKKGLKTEKNKLEDSIEVKYIDSKGNEKNLSLKSEGTIFSKENKIVVPTKIFIDSFEGINLNDSELKIIITGEVNEIEEAIETIKEYIKKLNGENCLEVNDYFIGNRSEEGKILKIISYLVVLIAIINSFAICSLWIDCKEKEIVMRKVVGASNIDIFKLFFKELGVIAVISLVLAVGGQGILSYYYGGYFMFIKVKVTFINIIYTIIFTFLITLTTTIPFLNKINKLNLVEMLKEN